VSLLRRALLPLHWAGIILAPALRPLIQIVAALVLAVSIPIALIGFVVEAPRDVNRLRYRACTLQIENIVHALDDFKADCGAFPSRNEELAVLVADPGNACWKGPYLKEVPVDPWNRPFIYLPSANLATPEVVSYGADQLPGGEYFDADISSRNLHRSIPTTPREIHILRIQLGIWTGAWISLAGSIAVLAKTRRKKVKTAVDPCVPGEL